MFHNDRFWSSFAPTTGGPTGTQAARTRGNRNWILSWSNSRVERSCPRRPDVSPAAASGVLRPSSLCELIHYLGAPAPSLRASAMDEPAASPGPALPPDPTNSSGPSWCLMARRPRPAGWPYDGSLIEYVNIFTICPPLYGSWWSVGDWRLRSIQDQRA